MADDKKTSGTDYVVLWQPHTTTDEAWEELGSVRAASDAQAKNKALAQWKPEGGRVVSVPARSWKPENKQPELRFR